MFNISSTLAGKFQYSNDGPEAHKMKILNVDLELQQNLLVIEIPPALAALSDADSGP